MNSPLTPMFLIVISGGLLIGYLLGFTSGRGAGLETGLRDGKREGKKEGAIKAFAVGFDRGKRYREEQEEKEETSSPPSADGPGWFSLSIVTLTTVVLLSIWRSYWAR